MKKEISCSYALIVVILFAVICFLSGYIIVNRKLNYINEVIYKTDCIDTVKCNCDEKVDSNYKDIGVTSFYTDDFQGIYSKIFAEIVNGNILLKYNDQSITLNTVNAKSLLYKTHHQGGNYILFYITEDNRLYEVTPDLYSIFKSKSEYTIDENAAGYATVEALSTDAVAFSDGEGLLEKEVNYDSEYTTSDKFPNESFFIVDSYGHKKRIFFRQQASYYGGFVNTFAHE